MLNQTVRTLIDFEAILEKALAGEKLTFIIAKVKPGEDSVALPRQEAGRNDYRFSDISNEANIRIINPFSRRRKKRPYLSVYLLGQLSSATLTFFKLLW
jgi:hypothetical protein